MIPDKERYDGRNPTITVPAQHVYNLKPGDTVAVRWPGGDVFWRICRIVSETVIELDYREIYMAHRSLRFLFLWGSVLFGLVWCYAFIWSLL